MKLYGRNGEKLSDLLISSGCNIIQPCGGRGACGGCAIRASGEIGEASEAEKALIAGKGKSPNEFRLACMCKVYGQVEAILLESDAEALSSSFGKLPEYDGSSSSALGIAVDLGTTTIALQLFDMRNGILLSTQTSLNPQTAYGSDVLSRIAHSDERGPEALCLAVRDEIWKMAEKAISFAKADASRIERLCIAGNTTMLHFLLGLDPHGIGVAPFTAQSLFGESIRADSIFPKLSSAELYLPNCISAYIGADIACGIAAISTERAGKGPWLLIDAGTNGEMALMMDGKITCAATAAGPAFEGAQISMGMIAKKGAVYQAYEENGEILVKTIGGAQALGVCGTGLVSAAKLALETHALEDSGYLKEDPFVLGGSGISLTGRDFRQLQLAKSAIAAGMESLLRISGCEPSELNEMLFAGGFGNFLNPDESARIGLIPKAARLKAKAVGNTSLFGAAMALFSRKARQDIAAIAKTAVEVKLSSNPLFTELYMDHMMFEEF
ncbi:MAG: ASKHA domain-containing protein [Clostridiales bacterium]|jgi:uncharacterized 2Fe-2S/4Fe-4S cluster protein (DUF4445 family)|nr:ASKHA domain-containing protein [Clostridiales bacterium]